MEVIKKYLRNNPLLARSSVVFILALLVLGVFAPFRFAHAIFGLGSIGDLIQLFFFMVTGIAPLIIIYELLLVLIVISIGFIPVLISSLILSLVVSDKIINLPYTHGGIVDIGWNVTRDIANLAFIAILLVMAVRTIIGQPEKGVKLLPKLIGIALLINFTKVIAGVVVDFANIITNYFLSPVLNIGNLFIKFYWDFLSSLSIMKVVSLFVNFELSVGWLKELLFTYIKMFTLQSVLIDTISAAVAITIGIMIALTLLIFSGVFFMRYIQIWILVIFSPLAFAAMILPDTAGLAKRWWSDFTKWCFIGVGPAFILFLVARMMSLIKDKGGLGGLAASSVNSEGFWGELLKPFYLVFDSVLFAIVLIAFMWIGLGMALKMNSKVGGAVMKNAGRLKSAAQGFALKRYGKDIQNVGTKVMEKVRGGKYTGFAGRGISSELQKLGGKGEALRKKQQAEHATFTQSEKMVRLKATNTPATERADILASIHKDDPEKVAKLFRDDQAQFKSAQEAVEVLSRMSPGDAKALMEIDPRLAGKSSLVTLDSTALKDVAKEEERVRSEQGRELNDSERNAVTEKGRVQSYVRGLSEQKIKSANATIWTDRDVLEAAQQSQNYHLTDALDSAPKINNAMTALGKEDFAKVLLKRPEGINRLSQEQATGLQHEFAKNAADLTSTALNNMVRRFGREYVADLFRDINKEGSDPNNPSAQVDRLAKISNTIRDMIPDNVPVSPPESRAARAPQGRVPPPPTVGGGSGPEHAEQGRLKMDDAPKRPQWPEPPQTPQKPQDPKAPPLPQWPKAKGEQLGLGSTKAREEQLDAEQKTNKETAENQAMFSQLRADYERLPEGLRAAINLAGGRPIREYLMASPAKRLWTSVAGVGRVKKGVGPLKPTLQPARESIRDAVEGIKKIPDKVSDIYSEFRPYRPETPPSAQTPPQTAEAPAQRAQEISEQLFTARRDLEGKLQEAIGLQDKELVAEVQAKIKDLNREIESRKPPTDENVVT